MKLTLSIVSTKVQFVWAITAGLGSLANILDWRFADLDGLASESSTFAIDDADDLERSICKGESSAGDEIGDVWALAEVEPPADSLFKLHGTGLWSKSAWDILCDLLFSSITLLEIGRGAVELLPLLPEFCLSRSLRWVLIWEPLLRFLDLTM